jgi:hypothetical protein
MSPHSLNTGLFLTSALAIGAGVSIRLIFRSRRLLQSRFAMVAFLPTAQNDTAVPN